MTAKQKILTGAAVLVLTGLPVYQQVRINALNNEMVTLREAATEKGKRVAPVMAAVSGGGHAPGRTGGPGGDPGKTGKTAASGGEGEMAKVQGSGTGAALFSKRGDGVIWDSFRGAPQRSSAESGALPAVSGDGSLADLAQRVPRSASGHVNWDHVQATGAPDTTEAGDRPTAWAPRSPKSGEQWLQLGYDRAVEVKEINVHESYNSGAISKVTAFMPDGSEKTLWTGNAAQGNANEIQETSIPVPKGVTSSQIKVYLDTNRVESWPEIDAVELVGRNGSRQWASKSSASSSYSDLYSGDAGLEGTARNLGTESNQEYEGNLGSGGSGSGRQKLREGRLGRGSSSGDGGGAAPSTGAVRTP